MPQDYVVGPMAQGWARNASITALLAANLLAGGTTLALSGRNHYDGLVTLYDRETVNETIQYQRSRDGIVFSPCQHLPLLFDENYRMGDANLYKSAQTVGTLLFVVGFTMGLGEAVRARRSKLSR